MKKQIIIALSAIAFTSGLQALTTDEQVAANTIEIGLNSTSLESVSNTLAAFEERINTLEAKVTTLEAFHSGPREFTITYDTLSSSGAIGFGDQITSLNFNDGEWLYIETKGDMLLDGTIYTREMCTSDSRLTSYLNMYLSTTLDPMVSTWFNIKSDNELTYTKHSFESVPAGLNWSIATDIWGDLLPFERLNLGAGSSDSYMPSDVWPAAPIIQFENDSYTNTVTYRAGTTRLEACGF